MSNIFNTDSVTLFNIYFDKKTKTNKLKKTYLKGIDWQDYSGLAKSVFQMVGYKVENLTLVCVPYGVDAGGKKYIGPQEYKMLSDESDCDKYFTLTTHDKIVRGIVEDEIETAAQLKNLELTKDYVLDIKNVIQCDLVKNFELECS